MLDAYALILTQSWRNFRNNARLSPFLYVIFISMILFSIMMVAGITRFMIQFEFIIELRDIFFVILFMFAMKASYAFYGHYTTSEEIVYTLNAPVAQWKSVFQIILAILWVQLGIWMLLYVLFMLLLGLFGVVLIFPFEFILLTAGVVLGVFLGVLLDLFLFSSQRLRLIAIGIMMSCAWFFFSWQILLIILTVSIGLLGISLPKVNQSYLYIRRKKRKREPFRNWKGIIQAVFQKESTTLWRDNLFFSVTVSAVVMGIFCGYFSTYGAAQFLPESLRLLTTNIPPLGYAFIGVYVLVVYAAVFMGLNIFLNENHTVWLIHLLPVSPKTIVWGKVASLWLSFLACLPFVAFFSAFTQGSEFWITVWLLLFGFLSGCILSIVMGSYYCGRKSDILLLYSVSLLMFVVVVVGLAIAMITETTGWLYPLILGFILIVEGVLLVGAIYYSSSFLSIHYKKEVF